MSEPVITVEGLRMSYGELEAVRGIDLEVSKGEIFAFLGPNGAGKTTTVEILEGYRSRTGGEVSVLGVDPAHANRAWRQQVGFVLQECELTPELTVREAVAQYAGYYSAPRDVDETIGLVGLSEKSDARTSTLSGGQQRRLDVALALVGDPELLFLDEPTTGFDPAARRESWTMIEGLKALGKTIFLTTHYMDEAQHLADRVLILRLGEIVALGTPGELAVGLEHSTMISFRLPDGVPLDDVSAGTGLAFSMAGNRATLSSASPQKDLYALTGWAEQRRVELAEITVERPTLEDIFLELTGDGQR